MHPLPSRRGLPLAILGVAAALWLAAFLGARPAAAAPTDAEARVNSFYAALLDIMKQLPGPAGDVFSGPGGFLLGTTGFPAQIVQEPFQPPPATMSALGEVRRLDQLA